MAADVFLNLYFEVEAKIEFVLATEFRALRDSDELDALMQLEPTPCVREDFDQGLL